MSKVRLRKIVITGFRGARLPLSLDFTRDNRSIAIFGENAAGKSTISDAIEWFLTGRIDHLWKEDCKEESLRNVNIGNDDNSIVSIEFNDKELSGQKILNPDFKTETTNKNEALNYFLAGIPFERHILRHADLTRFINEPKGNKRNEIANIIGYEDILKFRNTIQQTLNSLRRDANYTSAKKMVEDSQSKLLENYGSVISTVDNLYDMANEITKPYAVSQKIINDTSYEEIISELKGKVGQEEKVEKRLKMEVYKSACESLKDAIVEARKSEDSFLPEYEKLIDNRDKIKQLNLDDFLNKGKIVLESDLPEDGLCPFCGSAVDLDHLKAEISERLKDLEANRKEFENTRKFKEVFVNNLNKVSQQISSTKANIKDIEVPAEFVDGIDEYSELTSELLRLVSDRFETYETIKPDKNRTKKETALLDLLTAQKEIAEEQIKTLQLTPQETKLVDDITKLSAMRQLYLDYESNNSIKVAFEKQITSLTIIFEKFREVQNSAIQDALDIMSDDIGKYYGSMHPDENVDSVRLRISGEEGVEFEYSFHGQKTFPPRKYLSESHLNSLGIALFLASVNLFNKRSNFFILDDVVTSLDMAHRRRLIRLIREEFNNWQVILLTHERVWFDIIRREVRQEGWLLKELEWNEENGISMKGSYRDLKELIEQDRGKQLSANDLRILSERLLKDICQFLEVKVAFRFNDENENRMPGELLSELRSTLNRKCPELKDHPVFSNLEASLHVGTTGSHDRSNSIGKSDIDLALADMTEFETLFYCEKCHTPVSSERFINPEGKITCSCGEKTLGWKR